MITNRFIKKNEVKELQLLLHEAYKSDTQLGINFQAARVTLQQIDEHIENTATFVTEINHTIVATVSVRLPWSKIQVRMLYLILDGLLLIVSFQSKVMQHNLLIGLKKSTFKNN